MKIHRIWATIVGLVSFTIGVLRFFVHSLNMSIPLLDGIIHIVTGLTFIAGAWCFSGKYVRKVNLFLGIVYIVFGAVSMNWPHIILGVISTILGLTIKTTTPLKSVNGF